jgi:hypothetical protein
MTTSTCTDGGPPHHHRYQIYNDGILHIGFLPEEIESFSMRYNPSITVSVISIFEAFEYVSFKAGFDYVTYSWKLCSFPCCILVVDIVP